MEEILISFKTAVLAKEKGFNEECGYCYKNLPEPILYHHRSKMYTIAYKRVWKDITRKNSDMLLATIERYSASTQSLLQKWLREIHRIDIYVYPHGSYGYDYEIHTPKLDELIRAYDDYDTYEEALEAGLIHALKLVK